MSTENNIVTGVQFYLGSDVNDWLNESYAQEGRTTCEFSDGDNFSYDIIDQPFHCNIRCENGDAHMSLFIRNELGGYTEGSCDMGVVMHLNDGTIDLVKNSGRIGGHLANTAMAFYCGGHQLRKHVLEQNKMPDFADMDLEMEGVIVTRKNDTLAWKRVAGKKRPDMACTTLFGGVQMMRPYFDEIMGAWGAEVLDFEELVEEAEDGDENAMDRLGMAYLNGDEELDVKPDPKQAFYWFKKLAEAGNSNGQFNLGLYYAKGFGVERSFEQAVYWMEQAAMNDDADAAVLVKEYRDAMEAEKPAELGDAQAQADLARILMKLGNSLEQAGTEKDYADSFMWAQKSAEQNNGDGLWTLALAYEHGRGVKKDVKKAVELYRRGTDVGHAPSQHSLGCYYIRGEVVSKDEEQAYKLFCKSADQGYELAYHSLGICYQFGHGVQDDMKRAIAWYEKYLETNSDPELERKVSLFKMLNDCAPKEGEIEQFTSNLPDGYLEALERFAAEENAGDEEPSPIVDWINGKLFVLSGLSNADMTRAEKIITDNGGIIKSSVVLNTNYVIYDDNFGETKKITRAKELIGKGKPIQMLTVREFNAKLSGSQTDAQKRTEAKKEKKGAPSKRKVVDGEQGCTICLLEGDQVKCWVQNVTVIPSGIPMEHAKLIFELYNLSAGEYSRAAEGDTDVSYVGLYGLEDEILEARKKLNVSEIPEAARKNGLSIRKIIAAAPQRYECVKPYFAGKYDVRFEDFDWRPVKEEQKYFWVDLAPVTAVQYERYADTLHHVYHVAELFGETLPFDLNDPDVTTIFGSGQFEALLDLSYGC